MRKTAEVMIVGDTHLNKYYIGQSHSECISSSDLQVVLTDAVGNLIAQIVDPEGNICNFPGIESCPALSQELPVDRIAPVVKYSATFERTENGQYLMIWTVRPDGRFWMDSWGFGAEDYEWVDLYAPIDENGKFVAPFRLHSIGYRKFIDSDNN